MASCLSKLWRDRPQGVHHARMEVLKQFNRDTRLLALEQAWWRANPLGMLRPEMDAALVTSGGEGPPVRRGDRWSSPCRHSGDSSLT